MKKILKSPFLSIGCVGLLVCICFLWCYLEIIKPYRFLVDLQMAMASNTNTTMKISYTKTRNACHKMLRYKIGNHHTMFELLSLVGNHESIPYLLQAFESEDDPADQEGASCCVFLCRGALEKTTGMDLGLHYEPWEKWWQEEGSKLPDAVIDEKASRHWKEMLLKRQVTTPYLDDDEL